MEKNGWVKTTGNLHSDKCPKCGGITEVKINNETIEAERCPKCRWIVRFTDDGPKASSY